MVTVTSQFDSVKVRINGTLHLQFNRSDLVGVESWKWDRGLFCIEYTLRGGTIATEYDDAELWAAVLAGLDAIL